MGSTRGGQANEAGSVHRRSVAAFIAVYGLLGRPVPGLHDRAKAPTPVRIEFETDEPTDDLTVRFSDGSSAFISAKHECGVDQQFRDTVDQWTEQATGLSADDLVVLAVARVKGDLKGLNDGLSKRRQQLGGLSAAGRKALTAFDKALEDESSSVKDTVQGSAHLLIVDASEPGATHYEMARDAIGGRVVTDDQASATVDVLAKSFHDQASRASGSDIEDWVDILTQAGIRVFSDANGPAGARVQARRDALLAYNIELTRHQKEVDLSLLADDLPNLRSESMQWSLRAAFSRPNGRSQEVGLLALIRAWRRLLLVGLPGAGKSTAVREIAAYCVANEAAPQPIVVEIGKLSRSDGPQDLRLHHLARQAAGLVEREHQNELERALTDKMRSGQAMLILDGLDEAGSRAPAVAEAIRQILEDAHPDLSVLVTTRESARVPAGRLKLPEARLLPPRDLRGTVDALLEHIASERIAQSDRADWLKVRRAWLARSEHELRGLIDVPLLAVLVALVVGALEDYSIPTRAADVLRSAVVESAKRWEHKRREAGDLTAEPTRTMLTDAFGVIGYAIQRMSEISRVEVVRTVADRFASPAWRRSPIEAEELAGSCVDFWDSTVSVFVFDQTDHVRARSRVFVEVASAMWVSRQAAAELGLWVEDAVAEPATHNSLALAAQLDARVVDALLTISATNPSAAVLLGTQVVHGECELADTQVATLAEHLHDHAVQAQTDHVEPAPPGPVRDRSGGEADSERQLDETGRSGAEVDGPVWPFVALLCCLPLEAERRARYIADTITSAAVTRPQRILCEGLQALSGANFDGRALSEVDREAINSALKLPLAEIPEPVLEDGTLHFSVGEPLLSGQVLLALGAARRAGELNADAHGRIRAFAGRSALQDMFTISGALRDAGVDTRGIFELPALAFLSELIEALGPRPEHRTLEYIAELSLIRRADGGCEDSWRLSELRRFLRLIQWPGTGLVELKQALLTDRGLLLDWWRPLCYLLDADTQALSQQAQWVLRHDGAEADLLADLLKISPQGLTTTVEARALSPVLHASLIRASQATSDWVRGSVEYLLERLPPPKADH